MAYLTDQVWEKRIRRKLAKYGGYRLHKEKDGGYTVSGENNLDGINGWYEDIYKLNEAVGELEESYNTPDE